MAETDTHSLSSADVSNPDSGRGGSDEGETSRQSKSEILLRISEFDVMGSAEQVYMVFCQLIRPELQEWIRGGGGGGGGGPQPSLPLKSNFGHTI